MEDIENIICCPICMEVFRVPRMLPCQHTFCENCLSIYIKDRGIKRKQQTSEGFFPCPLCRDHVTLSKAPYDGTIFPLNLTIVALADTAERLKSMEKKAENSSGSVCSSGELKDKKDAQGIDNENVSETTGSVNETTGEHEDDIVIQCSDYGIKYKKLYKTDIFTEYALRYIVIPISVCRWRSVQVSSAAVRLLLCLIVYMYALRFVISYDIQLIFVFVCFPLFIDVVKFCKNLSEGRNARESARNILRSVVIHIVSVSIIVSFLILTLVSACVVEGIRTLESSDAIDDDMDNVAEETLHTKVIFVFNTAWHIMLASIDNLHSQWSAFKHTLCDILFLGEDSCAKVADEW